MIFDGYVKVLIFYDKDWLFNYIVVGDMVMVMIILEKLDDGVLLDKYK